MDSKEIRKRFLDFFAKRGHKIVPSSSLIPDDPSVLLTTAGMQQFKPYYTGAADPLNAIHPSIGTPLGSKNAASIQKSFRTSDIDEVGDESHLTFFEMLGNFSFGYKPGEPVSPKGGYFKEEAIKLAYDFFKEINLPIEYVTVFEGDPAGSGNVSPDSESEKIWKNLGVNDVRKKGRADNFWGPTGSEGPCGPTTEIYVNGVEIWNIVFNEYFCKPDKTLKKLAQNGVDTGMGLERLAMVLQNKKNIFETDLFVPTLKILGEEMPNWSKRIIADHIRGSIFLIGDGVVPSNKGQGSILRGLIRRALPHLKEFRTLKLFVGGTTPPEFPTLELIAKHVMEQYGSYPEYQYLNEKKNIILDILLEENERFAKVYARGEKKLNSLVNVAKQSSQRRISGGDIFNLVTADGLSLEWIKDTAKMHRIELDLEGFAADFEKHREISRAGLEKKFGGHGLILDTGELKAADEAELKKVTRLHTATHLLNAALRKILGPVFSGIEQRGSDITAERTRFDFLFPRKLTNEEIKQIEDLVNYAVAKNFSVTIKEMPVEEAKKSGVLYFYKGNYPPTVKVYTIGDENEIFSRELCGGPHVARTGEIGKFKILKEESSSAGVRRIRATAEP